MGISGDKKTSSVWRKGRETVKEQADKSVESPDQKQKQKPVLTEEMERSIIYGGFKKKSREDKLVAVKREIEARFKAEEERGRRAVEKKREAEEKEREKQRIAEEKLRREREKLKEEKKRLQEMREEEEELLRRREKLRRRSEKNRE